MERSANDRVGFCGLGIMGSRMAANLARAGFDLTVWNRTRSTAEAWAAEHGAQVAETPAQVGERCGVVITMVVDGAQVEQVLTGTDGVADSAAPGTLCIDMSTIAPADTRRIGKRLAARGLRMLDAPVSGSSPKAEDGTLTIMVGGETEEFERAQPLFAAIGQLIVHVGALGQGEALKLINNALAAANTTAAAEGLLLAQKIGLDPGQFEQVIGAGSGASAMLAMKAGPMRRRDYEPLFKLDHMLKDVRLCLEQAEQAGIPFESADYAGEVLGAASDKGFGEQDFAALIEALDTVADRRT
ncbi:MAG: NAD(P)-dependent oxidoreductase [Actinobacteria bacterium]|nr:NAD(P)-dependent oxidoreductase [Actinomycetota bacterium]